ncbi:MAG TPA: hypothetical protein PLC53_02940, partial [Bacilli bacterium]|nr:hypothetical protein [Bacilli bacterium]
YVDENNDAKTNIIYKKTTEGQTYLTNPSKYLLGYLSAQGVELPKDVLVKEEEKVESEDEILDI